eukprot:TRINITY_DN3649_c0_g1_i1.p1 TRINITY_DN3649_c0_g1~~TRINITY_DN3649_c0_g1_i1.p1  ORF type:complete len:306 (+),score=33.24 TRINITY_DN3649_c0_g1_i1:66-983(+)
MEALSCRFVILGSGCSNALPNLRHVLQPESGCNVCKDAMENPFSKNRRGMPSMLVSAPQADGNMGHLLVDCGLTFVQGAQRFFPQLGVRGFKSVLITHGHADAILGLNSLREVQLAQEPVDSWSISSRVPIYATEETAKRVMQTFGFMFPGGGDGNRSVGGFAINYISENADFFPLERLRVQPLPVHHGGTYVCLGFAFGGNGEFVYLSDVSSIPPETMDMLKQCKMDVLVLDALLKSKPIPPHIGLDDALDLIRKLRPKRAFLIGMSCEFDHEPDDAKLKALSCEGLDVRLSYDGLTIELDVAS